MITLYTTAAWFAGVVLIYSIYVSMHSKVSKWRPSSVLRFRLLMAVIELAYYSTLLAVSGWLGAHVAWVTVQAIMMLFSVKEFLRVYRLSRSPWLYLMDLGWEFGSRYQQTENSNQSDAHKVPAPTWTAQAPSRLQ